MGGCSTGRSTRKYGGGTGAITLQTATDNGATTTNSIAIGADVAGKALDIQDKTNLTLKNQLYQSYDYLLNEKYKIKLNQKTMDRLKNYFR